MSKKEQLLDEEIDDKDILLQAMREAEKAFDKYLSDHDYDGVYFCLDLTGYTLCDNFYSPTYKAEIKNFDAIRISEREAEEDIRKREYELYKK